MRYLVIDLEATCDAQHRIPRETPATSHGCSRTPSDARHFPLTPFPRARGVHFAAVEIGYHASHEQLAPRALLAYVKRVQRAGSVSRTASGGGLAR